MVTRATITVDSHAQCLSTGRYGRSYLFVVDELTLLMPFPDMLKVLPGCVPALIFIVTAPSSVRTSAKVPKIA